MQMLLKGTVWPDYNKLKMRRLIGVGSLHSL
jgi:hypothetical protein